MKMKIDNVETASGWRPVFVSFEFKDGSFCFYNVNDIVGMSIHDNVVAISFRNKRDLMLSDVTSESIHKLRRCMFALHPSMQYFKLTNNE